LEHGRSEENDMLYRPKKIPSWKDLTGTTKGNVTLPLAADRNLNDKGESNV